MQRQPRDGNEPTLTSPRASMKNCDLRFPLPSESDPWAEAFPRCVFTLRSIVPLGRRSAYRTHRLLRLHDGRTLRYFPDRLPIGIHPAGRGVVVYVVTDPWLDEFRVFLVRYAALVRALPAWTLRIVVPPHFPDIGQRAKQVVWNQLMTPLKTDLPRRAAMVFRAGSSAPRSIPLWRPGRTVLPSSRRLLRASIQGAVPCVEAGRRGGFRGLQLSQSRQRRD